MTRRIFGTILVTDPQDVVGAVYSDVPFGSKLEGMSYHAGVPVILWSIADEVDTEIGPKEQMWFYIARLGDTTDDDLGDHLGWFVLPDKETRAPITFNVFTRKQPSA